MAIPSESAVPRRGSAVGRTVATVATVAILALVTGFLGLVAERMFSTSHVPHGGPEAGTILLLGIGGVLVPVLAGVIVFCLVHYRVSRRLAQVLAAFRRAESGDLMARLVPEGDDELADLARAYNALMDKVAELTATTLHSDLVVKWAQRELRLKEEILAQSRSLTEVNEQLVRRIREASELLEIAEAAAATLEMDEMLDRLGNVLVSTLHVEEVIVLLSDPTTGDLRVAHTVGVADRSVAEALLAEPDDAVVRRCLETGEVEYVPDIEAQPALTALRGRRRTGGSLVSVPVRGRAQSTGAIVLLHRDPCAFQPQDLGFLKLVAHYVTLAVSNAALYRQTRDQAIHDPLTGLYNRRFFMESYAVEWNLARRLGSPLSVLMVDVDWFKQFNDRYGHQVGDEVLRVVARVLRGCTRDADVVGRYGGEEFIIALPGAGAEDALDVAEKMRSAIEQTPFPLPGSQGFARLTVSVGVASGPSLAPEDLIRGADLGLLQAKSAGRNRIVPLRPTAQDAVHPD